jgi:2-aminoadipate transaminase
VNYEHFLPNSVKESLANDPPGAWMPKIPSDCIRLHAGYPAPPLVPTADIKSAVDLMIRQEQSLPFQYIGSKQIEILRQHVKKRLAERDITVKDNELLITSGSSQAIDLIARTLLDRSAVVAVEAPTYMEALETFKNYTTNVLSIPIDKDGLKIDVLEDMLMDRNKRNLAMPRFVYTIPSFHNPTGVTMTPFSRQRLLELASEFDFLIVEDDAYGELSFTESPIPLKTIDLEERVLHVGSLSKVVAPGMRIGWIAGPSSLISAFQWFKKDLNHPFTQAIMGTYLQNINFKDRIEQLRVVYKGRRDIMIKALEHSMPEWVTWNIPDGGYFVWLHVSNVDTSLLLSQALSEGVSYIPGKYFFLDSNKEREFLRLSFSYEDPERMMEGIQKLGKLIISVNTLGI